MRAAAVAMAVVNAVAMAEAVVSRYRGPNRRGDGCVCGDEPGMLTTAGGAVTRQLWIPSAPGPAWEPERTAATGFGRNRERHLLAIRS